MQLLIKITFIAALLGLCWLGMMAVHELGHVIGVWLTGGEVARVVLHPLTISRTDVSVNLHPLVVAWAGPLVGALLPLVVLPVFRLARNSTVHYAQFFAGFCLIANGAYIALGSFERIGDCEVMLRHGTPMWLMLLFGALAVPTGLLLWHRLGSWREFWQQPQRVSGSQAVLAVAALLMFAAVEMFVSPR